MAISKNISIILKKIKSRKFIISVYSNVSPINPILNSSFKVKKANKEIVKKFTLISSIFMDSTCYYVEVDNELAHFSWLFKSNLLARQLKLSNFWIIGNCETFHKYRGNGLYGLVISKIIYDFPTQKFALFIDPNNISSIKGVTKIGLKCIGTYEIWRLLGVAIKITKINV
jgi:hypothetical protein